MARINRFYLFIAALVMSKTYSASAAIVQCDDNMIDKGLTCFQDLTTGDLTYDFIQANGYDKSVCLVWDFTDENGTGDPFPDSICIEIDYDNLANNCCDGDRVCERVVMGYDQCDSGGGSGGGDEPSYIPPSCISGEYWNLWGAPGLGANGGAGSCTTCPAYNYASGKYFSDLASSSQRNDDTSAAGSGGNIRFCYVPRGNVFTDNSGTFQYVNDCYYGS